MRWKRSRWKEYVCSNSTGETGDLFLGAKTPATPEESSRARMAGALLVGSKWYDKS